MENQILKNKSVAIIGGSSGIGLHTAKLAQSLGAFVTITGLDAEKLESAAHELKGAKTFKGDIANEKHINEVFDSLTHVDHVYIAAGGLTLASIVGGDLTEFKKEVDQRIWGNLHVIRAAMKKMKKAGSITLTSGIRADRPKIETPVTSMLCTAVEGLVRAAVLELAPIRINAIAPGLTDTPLIRNLMKENFNQISKQIADILPVGRIGTTEDQAQAVIFLMTNGYTNGEILHVDGGGRSVGAAI